MGKNIIDKPKQVKPVLIDILNHLKAKKIIAKFSILKSLNLWPRASFVLNLDKERQIGVTVQFWKTERIKSKEISCKEDATTINVYFQRVTKEQIIDLINEQISHRIYGYKNEMAFEQVLKILLKDGFIQSYNKSTPAQDQREHVDWYIKISNLKIGINIKSSKTAVSYGTKEKVLYLQFTTETLINPEYIKNIKDLIKMNIGKGIATN